jgi:Leucine-rich repeat (LRR) protein
VVRLSKANLHGSFPSELGSSLQEIILDGNQLTGSLPALVPAALQQLVLSHNRLNGTVPTITASGGSTNLKRLEVDDNMLTGTLPDNLGTHPNLMTIRLAGNRLSGSLPENVSRLQSSHCLSSPQLVAGCLHVACAAARMPPRRCMLLLMSTYESCVSCMAFAMQCMLSDMPLPADLQWGMIGYTALQVLDLSHNNLTGTLPDGWKYFPALKELYMSFNNFTVSLAAWLGLQHLLPLSLKCSWQSGRQSGRPLGH